MNNQMKWINRQVRTGWILLAVGVVIGIGGILLPVIAGDLPFNERIITGLGILLVGIGVANLVRYAAARRDPQAAVRLVSAERDERSQLIRARAGSRAFWVSIAMTYAGLMWSSFAGNGSLPEMSGDALWFFLAAAVVVPAIVYVVGIVYEEQNN